AALPRQLLVLELYSPVEGCHSILSVTRDDGQDEELAQVEISIYSKCGAEDWVQDKLFRTNYRISSNLHSEYLTADDIHQLYWLTNPVVGVSKFSRTVAWVYYGQLWTLDYVGPKEAKAAHGYVGHYRTIPELSVADVRARGLAVNEDGTKVVIVTEPDDVLYFTRTPRSPSTYPDHADYGDEYEALLWGLQGGVSWHLIPENRQNVNWRWRDVNGPGDVVPFTKWDLEKVWYRDVLGAVAGQRIKAFTVLNHHDLSPDLQPKFPPSSLPPFYLLLIYSNAQALLLDLSTPFSGSFIGSFLRSRWDMVISLTTVVALFVVNEIRSGITLILLCV
ncbi:hypothetical protein HK104_000623, partial [Borealophlyctis nickersoniae]